MRPIAFLFALSVAANAASFGYFLLRPPALPPVKPDTLSGAKTVEGISAASKHWLLDDRTVGLEQLRDQLLADGLPLSAVEAIIEDRLWRSRQVRIDEADLLKKRPWWQQTEDQLPGDDLRQNRLSAALGSEFHAQMLRLFPHRESLGDLRRTAFLPPAKRTAVQALLQDYEELRSSLRAKAGDPWMFSADSAQMVYLREEEERDTRALLTPAEYEGLKLRDPHVEGPLKRAAAIVGFSEQEFLGMKAIADWRNAEGDKFPYLTDPFAASSPEQQELQRRFNEEAARRENELLGTDRYNLYLYAGLPEYDFMARYAARYDLPPSSVMEYLKLTETAMGEMRKIIVTEATPDQRRQAIKSWVKNTKKSLNDVVGSNPSEGLSLDNLLQQAIREEAGME